MKEFPCQSGGSNLGPLACESEMLTTTPSDLVIETHEILEFIYYYYQIMHVCAKKEKQGCCTVYTYIRTVSS